MTLHQHLTSLIADAEHTKALDLLEQHLRAQWQAGDQAAHEDYLRMLDARERLGDEAAAVALAEGMAS